MTEPVRVLVVDDEPYIVDVLSAALAFEGFSIQEASDGGEALTKARTGDFDCIVLDVMLPDVDGFEVCRRLRSEDVATPVLFLTARDAHADKLEGLALGDDYVTKPFSSEELVARIRAVLRRTGAGTGDDARRLRCGDLVLDLDSREVWRAGEPVSLTATEFNLLRYLATNQRRVLSRTQILDEVWDHGYEGDSNIVEIYISYLRKKVDREGPPLIHTVRGVGYTLRETSR
ncbi:MAG: response regulator transcription factor [Acidimicrobiales bacterium]